MKIRGIFIFLCVLLTASLAWGRGGGGCLEAGTLIASPAGPMPIERLKPGDAVWAVVAGQLQQARVEATSQVEPDDYVEITAAGRTLRATAEHPVQIGPGTFRIAANLQPGDAICVREGNDFKTVPIGKIARVTAVHPAFNLLVMPGGLIWPMAWSCITRAVSCRIRPFCAPMARHRPSAKSAPATS